MSSRNTVQISQVRFSLFCVYSRRRTMLRSTKQILILGPSFSQFQKHYKFLCYSAREHYTKTVDVLNRTLQYKMYSMDSLQPIRPFRMSFPSEIIPRILYLGDVRSCRDREALKAVGITHIVNVTKDLNDEFREDFQYYRIPMWDDFRRDVKKHFKNAFSFIDSALKDNGTVFIHCQAC